MKKIRAACSELAPMRSLHPLSFLVCDGQAAGSRMLDGGGAAAAALPPLTSDIATVDASTKLRIMLRDMRFAVFILRNAPCWLRLLRPGGTLCVCSARSAPSVSSRSWGGSPHRPRSAVFNKTKRRVGSDCYLDADCYVTTSSLNIFDAIPFLLPTAPCWHRLLQARHGAGERNLRPN